MINDEICKLRNKLNNSIVSGEDYDKIYRISVELDELITEYYIKEKSILNVEEKGKKRKNNNIGIKKEGTYFRYPLFAIIRQKAFPQRFDNDKRGALRFCRTGIWPDPHNHTAAFP